jgi:DNA (cytosine-5)-methyltransferase 1
MRKIKVGSDFSGVGAFDQALRRLGIDYETVFSCDMDKYARTTYIHNYGEPKYYPLNVYDREIPEESLDIYMTSPPCQAFSLAGKRLGKEDKRGVLFFNSHEFIEKNKPRFFIFENVKGLLSDDNGNTFQEWVNMLGGKSVNGLPILFPYKDSVPYHIYWKVLNAKEHGVPQNRERVFIIGIRDDQDNNFRFPSEEHLTKRLKNLLENEVEEKYYVQNISNIQRLSDTLQKHELPNEIRMIDSYNKTIHEDSICISTRVNASSCTHLSIPNNEQELKILDCYNNNIRKDECCGTITQHCSRDGMTNGFKVIQINTSIESGGKQPYQQNRVFDENGISPSLLANLGGDRNHNILNNYKIRRLTPRECFRLMNFPDTFDFSCVSDSQAYKQAGNSIVVRVLEKIIKNLSL